MSKVHLILVLVGILILGTHQSMIANDYVEKVSQGYQFVYLGGNYLEFRCADMARCGNAVQINTAIHKSTKRELGISDDDYLAIPEVGAWLSDGGCFPELSNRAQNMVRKFYPTYVDMCQAGIGGEFKVYGVNAQHTESRAQPPLDVAPTISQEEIVVAISEASKEQSILSRLWQQILIFFRSLIFWGD